jgi:phospholipid/cholesterol/gamma-HCH transport system substrate-binding protein
MNRKTLELWVGLFVAAGLLALAMLAFKVGNLTSADVLDGYKLKARFENIGGLKVKSAVTMAGVRIGRVTHIYFDIDKYQAVVVMDIDGRYKSIPKDTSASILTSGLLGEQYVGLDPGGDDVFLKDGETLQLSQSAIVLEKMISQFLFSQASGSGKGK